MKNEFIRYITSGVLNSLVGYIAFLFALHYAGLSAVNANFISYLIGLCFAYLLNLFFVFRNTRHTLLTVICFFVAFCVSYSINLMVLWTLINLDLIAVELSQICAMVAYTVTFYILNRNFVWRVRQD